MSGKKKSGSARAVPRAYGRLTRHERDTVQRMLERRASCREIARELGRSPSTVSAEVASHRFVTAPKARRGERVDASADLSAACPRLAAWPRCCNGCGRYRAIGCKRRPHVFYEARAAQLCADSVLVSSRRGIDADEPAAAARLEAIRDCLRRGLSPEQMAARNGGPVDLSPSTIYRWVSAGYDGMTNMELRLFFTTTKFRISRLISFGFHRFAKVPHPFFANCPIFPSSRLPRTFCSARRTQPADHDA